MLFVRVVRKKLNGKKALLNLNPLTRNKFRKMFEVFELQKNKHLPKKFSMCTSFFEFLGFEFYVLSLHTFKSKFNSGGIGFRKVHKYKNSHIEKIICGRI